MIHMATIRNNSKLDFRSNDFISGFLIHCLFLYDYCTLFNIFRQMIALFRDLRYDNEQIEAKGKPADERSVREAKTLSGHNYF